MKIREASVSVYDGRDCMGKTAIEDDGSAAAFNADGVVLGTFPDRRTALSAIEADYAMRRPVTLRATAAKVKEARRRAPAKAAILSGITNG
jgi:hypothetical protein